MKLTVIASILLIPLLGCLSPVTLKNRELNTYDKFSQREIVRETPHWFYINSLAKDEALTKESLVLKNEISNTHIIVAPVLEFFRGGDLTCNKFIFFVACIR